MTDQARASLAAFLKQVAPWEESTEPFSLVHAALRNYVGNGERILERVGRCMRDIAGKTAP